LLLLLLLILFCLSFNQIALFLISTRDILSPAVFHGLCCSTQWSLHSPIFEVFDSRRTHVYNAENTPSHVVLDSL